MNHVAGAAMPLLILIFLNEINYFINNQKNKRINNNDADYIAFVSREEIYLSKAINRNLFLTVLSTLWGYS